MTFSFRRFTQFTRFVSQQKWLDKISQPLLEVTQDIFSSWGETGQRIQDVLYGIGLGHPLHTIINDIPIGMWTAALALDALHIMTENDDFGEAADATINVGLVGAVGAAVTGMVDWQHLKGDAQRVGTGHALLNDTATALYGLSFALRRSGRREMGWSTSLLGYSAMLGAAYLGGHMVFEQRVGIDHTARLEDELPKEFKPVMADEDLHEGDLKRAMINEVPILLTRYQGEIYAMVDTCSHKGGPLSNGKIEEECDCVVCPWHQSHFALEDGRVIHGPSVHQQPVLEHRIRDGKIEVRGPARHG